MPPRISLSPLELEDTREETMAESFSVAGRAGELLGEWVMRGGIRDHRRSDGGSGLSGPRGWLHDSPHDVPDVHEHHDEGDDEDPGDDVEADWMLRGEAIQPIDQVLPLACEPGHHAPLLGPLKLGARKDLTDHAPQRVGRNLDEGFGQCIPVPVPNCSLRT